MNVKFKRLNYMIISLNLIITIKLIKVKYWHILYSFSILKEWMYKEWYIKLIANILISYNSNY